MKLLAVLAIPLLLISSSAGEGCGGLVDGDAGQVEIPAGTSGGSPCIWIIKLLDRARVRFTLDRIGGDSVVSLYPEHESTETVLIPIRLQDIHVGATTESAGKRLIVVFTQNGTRDDGLAFTWDSVEDDSNSTVIGAASYVDIPEGRIVFTRFGQQERLTWALSLGSSSSLELSQRVVFGRCDLIDACRCTYFAVYEVNPEGYLREVSRVCGRVSEGTVKNLYPQLVAFVYVNLTAAENSNYSVEIEWSATSGGGVTPTPTVDYPNTTAAATTPTPGHVYRECGGVVNVSTTSDTIIEYKVDRSYYPNEFCIWTIQPDVFVGSTNVTIEQEGFQSCCDGLLGFYVETQTGVAVRKCDFTNGSCHLESGLSYLVFTSDDSVEGLGFRARLRAFPGTQWTVDSTFFFTGSSGTFRYPEAGLAYRNNERLAAIFQHNTTNFLNITSWNLETNRDFLHRYTIYPYHYIGSSYWESAYTGNHSGPPSYVESNYSRLLLFVTDGITVGTGFSLSWGDMNNGTNGSVLLS